MWQKLFIKTHQILVHFLVLVYRYSHSEGWRRLLVLLLLHFPTVSRGIVMSTDFSSRIVILWLSNERIMTVQRCASGLQSSENSLVLLSMKLSRIHHHSREVSQIIGKQDHVSMVRSSSMRSTSMGRKWSLQNKPSEVSVSKWATRMNRIIRNTKTVTIIRSIRSWNTFLRQKKRSRKQKNQDRPRLSLSIRYVQSSSSRQKEI